MKKRFLSVLLALSLCISSQSMAFASQEAETGRATGETEISADAGAETSVRPESTETPTQPESTETPETPAESESTESTETPAQPESTEIAETPVEPESTESTETPVQPESTETPETDPETEETAVKTETDDDVNTLPEETLPQPGETATDPEMDTETETETEETTEELETEDDADTASLEMSLQKKGRMIRSVEKPDIPNIDVNTLTPSKVYSAMIALKDKDGYTEGEPWTNEYPYSDEAGYYEWKGGLIDGKNIVSVGCVAFAFSLSDAAFGNLPARMYAQGEFQFEDIKVGDILRVNNDAHTVIVLEVLDSGVIVAEGNISTGDHKGKVHWGRGIAKEEVMSNTSHYITRYPKGYISPDDPSANEIIVEGTLEGGLTWKLTEAGILTISGSGAMPDYSSASEQPWNDHSSEIRKVVIGNGVTSIGACAFWGCGVLSAEISSSVQIIGNSAFRDSGILSVKIPSSVTTIGDSAFQNCQSLGTVTVSEGVETIRQNAFNACTSLKSISLPASIGEVGAAAFFQCQKLTSATFAPGSKQVKMGDDMFAECWYLMSVKLPSSIDRISEGMFMNCLMLSRVDIPQGTERIGGSAFASCSALMIVSIPDSVTSIGTAAFSVCRLTDVYFAGDEAQWNRINKPADVVTAVSQAAIHYNATPPATPDLGEGDDSDNNDNNTGDNSGNDNNGQNPGDSSSDNKPGENKPDNNDADKSDTHKNNADKNDSGDNDSDQDSTGAEAVAKTWKPTTPDEVRRYACVGREAIRCTLPADNAYPVNIENAMQGPMCFKSFEAVLGEYTIGRTYNIYADSKTTYSTEQEVKITIKIPSALYKKDREYKMICVTKGGLPIVYEDLDSDPETITIETDKFHAYALVYKDL